MWDPGSLGSCQDQLEKQVVAHNKAEAWGSKLQDAGDHEGLII